MLYNCIRGYLGRIVLLFFISAIIAGAFALINPIGLQRPEREGVVELTLSEARALDPLWVDARAEYAYSEGHISNAINLNMDAWEWQFMHFIERWEPSKKVVAYCDGGPCVESHQVAKKLMGAIDGIEIYVLKGGYPEWLQQ